jgi:hypothetical protein
MNIALTGGGELADISSVSNKPGEMSVSWFLRVCAEGRDHQGTEHHRILVQIKRFVYHKLWVPQRVHSSNIRYCWLD